MHFVICVVTETFMSYKGCVRQHIRDTKYIVLIVVVGCYIVLSALIYILTPHERRHRSSEMNEYIDSQKKDELQTIAGTRVFLVQLHYMYMYGRYMHGVNPIVSCWKLKVTHTQHMHTHNSKFYCFKSVLNGYLFTN